MEKIVDLGDQLLVASCVENRAGDGGGLFVFDGCRMEQVDDVSSTGLAVRNGGLARVLRPREWEGGIGEIFIYDKGGIKQYLRVDGLKDPHDILWARNAFVVACPDSNAVLWISPSGDVVNEWIAPGENDSWHVNCLFFTGTEYLASAFGRHATHRAWSERETNGDGILFDIRTGRDILNGLASPHHPRFFNGAWAICNSGTSEVIQFDNSGKRIRSVSLDGFTRGFAISDDFLFVGESGCRGEHSETATIAVLRRNTWELIARLPVPCREIYDLVLVSSELASGIHRGFLPRAGGLAEERRLGPVPSARAPDPIAVCDHQVLLTSECSTEVTASPPEAMEVSGRLTLDCTVRNTGRCVMTSGGPNPVMISYRWFPEGSANGAFFDGLRSSLPRPLLPGESATVKLALRAPPSPGTWRLRIAPVHEGVCWFDDLDEANGLTGRVNVVIAASWPDDQPAQSRRTGILTRMRAFNGRRSPPA